MSYDDLVGFLMLYLEIDDAKTVFFDFAVNKHTMSSTDIYNQLKKLDIIVAVEKEFVKLLHSLLDKKEKSVYVNVGEVSGDKSKELVLKKIAPELKTPDIAFPVSHH